MTSDKLIVRYLSSWGKAKSSGPMTWEDQWYGYLRRRSDINRHSLINAKPNLCSYCGQRLRLNSLGEHVCDVCEFVDSKPTPEYRQTILNPLPKVRSDFEKDSSAKLSCTQRKANDALTSSGEEL